MVRPRLHDLPDKMRPHQPMHWQAVLVVAENERMRAECHPSARGLVLKIRKSVCEGKQKWNARRLIGSGGDDKIVDPP